MKLTRSVNKIFNNANDELAGLVTRSKQLHALTLEFREFLPDLLQSNCYIAGKNAETLSIYVSGPSFAAKLRYLSSELIQNMQLNSRNFTTIQQLSIKVLTPTAADKVEEHVGNELEMNLDNAAQMTQFAESMPDDELKTALLKLAAHGTKKQKS